MDIKRMTSAVICAALLLLPPFVYVLLRVLDAFAAVE